MLLIAAFVAANFIHLEDEDVFVGWILSLCILIPLLLIVFGAVKIVMHRMKLMQYNPKTKKSVDEKVQKMLQRTPKSFRDMRKDTGFDEDEDGGDEPNDAGRACDTIDVKSVEMAR